MSELDLFHASEGLAPAHFGLAEDGRAYVEAPALAKALRHSNSRQMVAILDDDEKGVIERDTPGGRQRVQVVFEEGMYRLLFRSNLPAARELTKRAAAILRQLRETGVVDTREQPAAERPMSELEMAQKYVAALERLEITGPKAEAFDELMSAEGDYPMAVAAQILGLGQNTLFARLRNEHVLIAGGKRHNTPLQQYLKHFRVATSTYDDGETSHVKYTTFVRPSGLDWIRKLLKLPAPVA